jgi:isochorismate pyruvate lyase
MTPDTCETMDHVRAEIDRLDRELVALIAERTKYIEAAARIKDDFDEVRLEWRIEEVVSKVLKTAEMLGLPARIAEPVWRELIDRSIEHEKTEWRNLHR